MLFATASEYFHFLKSYLALEFHVTEILVCTLLLDWLNISYFIPADPSKNVFALEFVSNKAKGQISKRVFQEKKAHQIFQKMNIFYPLVHIS